MVVAVLGDWGWKAWLTQLQAAALIEQGHVRVQKEVITDPAYLIPRNLEDYVTWVDGSKIKKATLEYKGQLDDFDLLQA